MLVEVKAIAVTPGMYKANDEDQNLMWLIPIYGYSHIQMWLSAGTVGASFGKLTALSYQNIKGVPL